jgi:formyl-CoA transferase
MGDPRAARTVDSPIHVDGEDHRPCGPAPDLGEHTREVLRDLGYADDRIAALEASGAVRCA